MKTESAVPMIPDSPDGQIGGSGAPVITLRLFAAARVAAGTTRVEMTGRTVDQVLSQATERWGPDFASVLARSRVWVNGEPAAVERTLRPGDEIAVLPPVSGGTSAER